MRLPRTHACWLCTLPRRHTCMTHVAIGTVQCARCLLLQENRSPPPEPHPSLSATDLLHSHRRTARRFGTLRLHMPPNKCLMRMCCQVPSPAPTRVTLGGCKGSVLRRCGAVGQGTAAAAAHAARCASCCRYDALLMQYSDVRADVLGERLTNFRK